ncbi:MAG: hypothetical protein K0R57_1652 [Paenibacillaceae bacterium]|jgi:uncharacterized membrane protein YsdA (DUF1294 family)|nr:hypothetical protein [Paenibacillaceae bacterium]
MVLYACVYLLIINLIGLGLMRSDKTRAKGRKYRIPERHLFITAVIGGAAGVFAGMRLYRHKTKHAAFYIGIPVLLFVQLVLLGVLWGKSMG